MTKAKKLRLLKALTTLKTFSAGEAKGNTVSVTDTCQVNNSAGPITFTLEFNNIGSAATTDAVLHDVTGTDTTLANNAKDSLFDVAVASNATADGKFLNIKSLVTATSETHVPANLDAQLTINGGVNQKVIPLNSARFEASGDTIIIDISIFFFHIN